MTSGTPPLAPEVSVIVPAYNEAGLLEKCIAAITGQLETIGAHFELLVVDDGSTDGTAVCLQELADADARIVPVLLSRNFGKEAAMQAGLDVAAGRAVILIDADLQHPPELIPRMYRLWQDGYEVVNAVKADRGRESPFHRWYARLFNAMLSGALGRKDWRDESDFKLLDREVVESLRLCPERGRFFRGLVTWVGFRQISIEFDVSERAEGTSKWSLRSLLRYSVRNLMAFTSFPLKVVALVGFVTVAAGAIMAMQTLWMYFSGRAVDGFSTVIVLMVIFSGAILTSLGVIAMYIAMMYEEQKARPLYVLRKRDLKRDIGRIIGLDADHGPSRSARMR